MERYRDAYGEFVSSVDLMPKDNRAVNELVEAYDKADENLRALNYLNKKILDKQAQHWENYYSTNSETFGIG